MLNIITGQKVKFTEINLGQQFTLITQLVTNNISIDVACFGLNPQQKLLHDDYMTFYNQPVTPCEAIKLQTVNNQQRFDIDLSKLPDSIDYLVLTATIDGQQTMQEIGHSSVTIEQIGQPCLSYAFDGSAFNNERAIMLFQVYRKAGIWRVNAIGQGFNGGLSALVTHFGGEVEDDINQMTIDNTSSKTLPTLQLQTNKVNLKKVFLEKAGAEHRVNLIKGDQEHLIVEAIWIDNGDNSANNDDLDLRVGILPLHSKEMVYIHAPLKMGSLTKMPYVEHQGDVQVASLSEPGKEVVLVNPEIARYYGGKVALVFSVYSAVTNGAVSIASLQPKMRMKYKDQVVESIFNIKESPRAKSNLVYTYVIGIAVFDENGVTLQHSGKTSRRMSEATPKLKWEGGIVKLTMDGKPMFKPI